jgi:thiol:disulfide interchange protein DsbD
VLARLYTDGEGEVYQRQQRLQQSKYQTVALPFYAVVDGTGRPVVSFPGLTRDPAQFVAFLEQGKGRGATAAVSRP